MRTRYYQLSVISYQLSVISYQLSVISYQLSVYQLSVISLSVGKLGTYRWVHPTFAGTPIISNYQ
ncbi:hypothetical protein B1L04_03275 [Microcystis aeruginosa KW]|uniref:Uncharacterized protein n=1 Tax=Microcystis aeruginosa KW TaxID=1960155 RepID=A0A1V4BV07_MICAE|nr:hypothetical protein [Microcystis aeruginosa]OPF18539.1 hypothetical protein B1L04_03275 [Microcystis aeruginosa KW]